MVGRSWDLENTEKADAEGSVKCKEDFRIKGLKSAHWMWPFGSPCVPRVIATPVDLRRGKPNWTSQEWVEVSSFLSS